MDMLGTSSFPCQPAILWHCGSSPRQHGLWEAEGLEKVMRVKGKASASSDTCLGFAWLTLSSASYSCLRSPSLWGSSWPAYAWCVITCTMDSWTPVLWSTLPFPCPSYESDTPLVLLIHHMKGQEKTRSHPILNFLRNLKTVLEISGHPGNLLTFK